MVLGEVVGFVEAGEVVEGVVVLGSEGERDLGANKIVLIGATIGLEGELVGEVSGTISS